MQGSLALTPTYLNLSQVVSASIRRMNLPENFKYTKDHEWAQVSEGESVVRVGITDYAQDALGDVVFVGLPKIGETVSSGDTFGEVESTKSVSDIFAPISGKVVAVNSELESNPELLNTDPYGAGWICEIEFTDKAEVETLMNSSQYEAFIA